MKAKIFIYDDAINNTKMKTLRLGFERVRIPAYFSSPGLFGKKCFVFLGLP